MIETSVGTYKTTKPFDLDSLAVGGKITLEVIDDSLRISDSTFNLDEVKFYAVHAFRAEAKKKDGKNVEVKDILKK
jgi:hypothetical protein